MNTIYKMIQKNYKDIPKYINQNSTDIFNINTTTLNSVQKLQLSIYEQRYKNIKDYIENTTKNLTDSEKDILLKYYFFSNKLNEINFIGTDFYLNTRFIKEQVPFLYRSVGRDSKTGDTSIYRKCKRENHIEKILKECIRQIKTGGKGELYSYSKCFGLMLYKYANITSEYKKLTIEIRKDAWLNAIDDENKPVMVQEYLYKYENNNNEYKLPYFCIDMSNARENSTQYLREWAKEWSKGVKKEKKKNGKEDYLDEEIEFRYGDDIVDPIGDAEVVTNYTNVIDEKTIMANNVERIELSIGDFCELIYLYFKIYNEKQKNSQERVTNFIKKSIDSLPENSKQDLLKILPSELKSLYSTNENTNENQFENHNKLRNIIASCIDWELEKKYMTKGVNKNQGNNIKIRNIYKSDNASWKVNVLKEILIESVRGEYSYINYGGNNGN